MTNMTIEHAWLDNLDLSTALSPVALLVGERVSDRFALSSVGDGAVRIATLSRAAWRVLRWGRRHWAPCWGSFVPTTCW